MAEQLHKELMARFCAQIQEADSFGFQWNYYGQVLDKICAECHEVDDAIKNGQPREEVQDELGDVLHAVLSLILFLQFDVESTLEKSLDKFDTRFEALKRIAQSRGIASLKGKSLEEIITLWGEAKGAGS